MQYELLESLYSFFEYINVVLLLFVSCCPQHIYIVKLALVHFYDDNFDSFNILRIEAIIYSFIGFTTLANEF